MSISKVCWHALLRNRVSNMRDKQSPKIRFVIDGLAKTVSKRDTLKLTSVVKECVAFACAPSIRSGSPVKSFNAYPNDCITHGHIQLLCD